MSFIEVPKQMLAKVWEAITTAQSAADTASTKADAAQTSASAKLPLSGGKMTGDITLSGSFPHLWKDTAASGLVICGAPDETQGARFVVMGEDRDANTAGMFECIARTSTIGPVALYGYPDKRLTWGGKHIVRSVDSVQADAAGNVALNALKTTGGTVTGTLNFGCVDPAINVAHGTVGQNTYIGSATRIDTGKCLKFGIGSGGVNRGIWDDSSGVGNWMIYRSSDNVTLYSGSCKIEQTSARYSSGTSWYRVYDDGFIIQGGRLTAQRGTITFPKAFTTTNYTVVASEISSSDGGDYCYETRTRSYTKTTFGYWVNSSSGTWIAMGY